jgi:hypothetical protein
VRVGEQIERARDQIAGEWNSDFSPFQRPFKSVRRNGFKQTDNEGKFSISPRSGAITAKAERS